MTVLNDWLVPVIVVDAMTPREALLASTRVRESVAPMQALGMELTARAVTTPFVDVHETSIPAREPHELTEAFAPTTFFDVSAVPLAAALPGTASNAPAMTASVGLKRIGGYPVMATETPVTEAAETANEVKFGVAAPVPSSDPVCSPSEASPAPVSVTR